MRVSMRFRCVPAVVAALLAGCSHGSPLPENAVAYSRLMSPLNACGTSLVLVSNASQNTVNVYSGKSICYTITGFTSPSGLAIDEKSALYVADTNASKVLVLAPPYHAIARRLSDAGQYPAGVVACNGYVAVTNVLATDGTAGSVSIYPSGAHSPSATLRDPNAREEFFPACEGNGNLYTTYLSASGGGGVNEWVNHTGGAKELTAIRPSFPGGIKWDGGKLWVGDQAARTIALWAPPFDKASKVIHLAGAGDPSTFALNALDDKILTADAATGAAEFYDLSGKNVGSLPAAFAGGVAFNHDDY